MALEDSCIFYNKMENLVSEIGANFINVGAGSRVPVKFNNGYYSNAAANYLHATDGAFDGNEFCAEAWLKTDWNCVNGQASDGQNHAYFTWWDGVNSLISFHIEAANTYMFYQQGGAPTIYTATHADLDWTAGDLVHFLWVYKRATIGATANTARLYFNGTLIFTSNVVAANNVTGGTFYTGVWYPGAAQREFDGAVDNLKIYNSATEETIVGIIANKDNEEWPVIIVTPSIIPVTCVQSAPRVMVAGHDLVALGYVEEIQPIKEYKTFQRDKLIQNNYRLKVKNFDEFFSLDNPVSQFKDSTWQYLPIQVYNEDNDLDWDGIIEDIPRFHQGKTAAILSVNAFKKYAREKASYVSSTWETAGDVAKGLMDAAGFTNYDNKSIQDTIAQLTANSCYIKANFQKDSDTNLQQALEKTAEAGAADCYSIRGIVNFKHFTSYTGGVKVNLTTADLKKAPAIRSLTKEIVNDYRIYYSGSETPVTDADAGNIGSVSREKFFTKDLREMGGKSTDQIIFKDAVSCQYIGEQLIRRSHINLDKANVRAVQEAKFAISLDYRNWTDLNTYLRLDFTDEAWVNKLLEIFVFTKNFKTRLIEITAYEAQE